MVLFASFFTCFVFYLKKGFSLAQICLKLSLKFLLRYWLNNIHCHLYYQNVFIGPNFCYVPCRNPFIYAKRTLIVRAVDVDPEQKYILRWKNFCHLCQHHNTGTGVEGSKRGMPNKL